MQSSKHSVVLSLGSNCGDRKGNVSDAMSWLRDKVLSDAECSDIYETRPVGHAGDNYFNAVVIGLYAGCVDELERLCKEYETVHGRDAGARARNEVPVDIDIVIADGEVLRLRDFRCDFFQKGYSCLSEKVMAH